MCAASRIQLLRLPGRSECRCCDQLEFAEKCSLKATARAKAKADKASGGSGGDSKPPSVQAPRLQLVQLAKEEQPEGGQQADYAKACGMMQARVDELRVESRAKTVLLRALGSRVLSARQLCCVMEPELVAAQNGVAKKQSGGAVKVEEQEGNGVAERAARTTLKYLQLLLSSGQVERVGQVSYREAEQSLSSQLEQQYKACAVKLSSFKASPTAAPMKALKPWKTSQTHARTV